MFRPCLLALIFAVFTGRLAHAEDNRSLSDRARQYLIDLVRLDTSNPPGNESRVAEYLKEVADANGIPNELLGADPKRLNFVARLKGTGRQRPLLLVAHSDVSPADKARWTADPFAAELRNGFIYGRGTWDAKGILATELAVMVEIKRRNIRLSRDLILLAESDGEENSSGIQWMIQHAWPKIDAEFGLNEGGFILESKDGTRLFQIQTAEKSGMRVVLTARGNAATGAIPREDNPIVRISRAVVKITDNDQPVRLVPPVRRYLRELAKIQDFAWLAPLLPRLENPATASAAAAQIRAKAPELDAILHSTFSPTIVRAGAKSNVIPNSAEAYVDVEKLVVETPQEILERIRQEVNDPGIEVTVTAGQQTPATEPSPTQTALYKAMERAIARAYPADVPVPFLGRTPTDSSFLRLRGMPVYGVPLFSRESGDQRAHGNDERIAPKNVEDGAELLWQIVVEVSSGNP